MLHTRKKMLHMLHTRKKMLQIRTQTRRNRVRHESFIHEERSTILPDRVPSLAKIAEQFLAGRPLDANLNRNLEYNEIENNPILKKGVDLADLPDIAYQVEGKFASVNDAVEKLKSAQVATGTEKQVSNPAEKAPEKVE